MLLRKKILDTFFILIIATNFSQLKAQESNPQINNLNKRINELEEINNENSELIKKLLTDLHNDQNSRGYFEIKLGASLLKPKDVEDKNKDIFSSGESTWSNFNYAGFVDFEIGKNLSGENGAKHKIGVGYQVLRSSLEGSFSNSSDKFSLHEQINIQTFFLRYTHLLKMDSSGKNFFGGGATIGYAPTNELIVNITEGNTGAQVRGEATSYLVELFGKVELQISRYISILGTSGYRYQKAENLRLAVADLVTFKTKVDLDSSGFYGTIGVAINY